MSTSTLQWELNDNPLKDDANLVAYWRFENNYLDSSGNSNTLSSGTAAPTYTSSGKFGGAYDFEISNGEYLGIADADQTGLDIAGDVSFSLWVKLESVDAVQELVSKYFTASDNRSYRLSIRADNTLQLTFSDDGTSADTHLVVYTGSLTLGSGQWTHVAATFDISTETPNIYVNSNKDGTVSVLVGSTIGNTLFDGTAPVNIGAINNTGTLDGVLDDVAIFNRVLTDSEVLSLYQARSFFGEDVGIGDTNDFNISVRVSISDNVGITDEPSHITNFFRAISDALSIGDSTTRTVEFSRSMADDIGLTDSFINGFIYIRDLADIIGLSDDIVESFVTSGMEKIKIVFIEDDKPIIDSVS